jgi:hypothetical protein
VHGRLIGSAFATAPVVCLTLAKWETVSGQFGGYLTNPVIEMTESKQLGFRTAIDCDIFQLTGKPHHTGGSAAFD